MASRIMTFIVMLVALFATDQIGTIEGAWKFIMQCGAGLGLVLIMRWYWWRINAWSEITATIAPFIVIAVVYILKMPAMEGSFPAETIAWLDEFPNVFLVTVAFTTISWLIVTFLTNPTDNATLKHFYQKVQPMGNWKPFTQGIENNKGLGYTFLSWLFGILFTYCFLFLIGKVILLEWKAAGINGLIVIVSFVALSKTIDKTSIFKV